MDKRIIRITGAAIIAVAAWGAITLTPSVRITVGILIGLPSFVLMIISRRQLGESFTVKPEARTLITTGLYSRIEHPMYVFLDLFLVSVIIAIGWPVLLLLWGVLVVIQILQSQREEKVLSAAFGDQYDIYREKTWF